MQIDNAHAAVPQQNIRGMLLLNGIGRGEDFLQTEQTIEAEVIFASAETANIRLDNGVILRARLSGGAVLEEGDKVLLSVKANDGDRLVLQIVDDVFNETIPEATPATLLQKAGLGKTQLVMSLVSAYHQAGFPVEAESMEQAAAILERFPNTAIDTAVFAAVNKVEIKPDNLEVINALLRSDFKADTALTRIFSLLAGRAGRDDGPQDNVSPAEQVYIKTETQDLEGRVGNSKILPPRSAGGSSIEDGRALQTAAPEQKTGLRDGELEELIELYVREEHTNSGRGVTNKEKGNRLIKSIEKHYFAEIKKQDDGATLKKMGDQLLGRLEMLKTLEHSASSEARSAADETEKLLGGLRLFQSLDKYSYLQIPVVFSGGTSTIELYVFNKKRGAKEKAADSTTLLLALDTEKLGHIEALVLIRNSDISIRFTVRDKEIADYVKNRMTALNNRVNINGYRLSGVSFRTGDEPVTPMTALKAAGLNDASRKINVRV